MSLRKELIYQCVSESEGEDHLTAQDIFDRVRASMRGMSLATVYRNLNELVSEHRIRRLCIPNQPDRYDTMSMPHDHLICTACGGIVDIPCIETRIARTEGCVVDHCKVTAYGRCKKCMDSHVVEDQAGRGTDAAELKPASPARTGKTCHH